MTLKLTILGCGSSGGVPRIGGEWGACDPANPKNRRRRCSVLLQKTIAAGTTTVLIDTSPDMREQMLSANVGHLDGAWYTHEHADHTHGIDELRAFYLRQRHRIPIWADRMTGEMLLSRFAYCFSTMPGSDYPPTLEIHGIEAPLDISTSGAGGTITATPFYVDHGHIDALGFRMGNVAYTPDVDGIPDTALPHLENLDVWIVDALRRTPHPTHFCLQQTLEWIERLKPRRAILTNMHIDLDFATLRAELPDHVEPAFDGLTFTF